MFLPSCDGVCVGTDITLLSSPTLDANVVATVFKNTSMGCSKGKVPPAFGRLTFDTHRNK